MLEMIISWYSRHEWELANDQIDNTKRKRPIASLFLINLFFEYLTFSAADDPGHPSTTLSPTRARKGTAASFVINYSLFTILLHFSVRHFEF